MKGNLGLQYYQCKGLVSIVGRKQSLVLLSFLAKNWTYLFLKSFGMSLNRFNGKLSSMEGKTPFLIGVAGGTASGKVNIYPSFMFCLIYIYLINYKWLVTDRLWQMDNKVHGLSSNSSFSILSRKPSSLRRRVYHQHMLLSVNK